MKKTTFAASIAAASTALLLAASPLAASAHVRVDPGTATPGSYTNLTFKVPTESATAGTVSSTAARSRRAAAPTCATASRCSRSPWS